MMTANKHGTALDGCTLGRCVYATKKKNTMKKTRSTNEVEGTCLATTISAQLDDKEMYTFTKLSVD